ncbi:hypothetical protein AVEN_210591-1, partial [Araneus ventricosus]
MCRVISFMEDEWFKIWRKSQGRRLRSPSSQMRSNTAYLLPMTNVELCPTNHSLWSGK